MSKSWRLFALALLLAGCIGESRAQTSIDGGAPATGGWKLSKIGNLSRVPGLNDRHKELLARNGFFLFNA